MKIIKGCKDMYNILISKKREPVKSISEWRDKGFNISDADWCNILSFHTKLRKNQNIIGCNLRYTTD